MSSPEVSVARFATAKGVELHGILHRPARRPRSRGIIICNPGIKSRVGPHRLYVAMARRFCALGFNVLRFDPEGLGDSEGAVPERSMADVLGSIQNGRLVESALAAVDWMQARCGNPGFVLSGLCGGAITGLFAASRDRRVDAVLGLGIPVASTGSDLDPVKYMTDGQLGSMRGTYLRKMFSPRHWYRFLTLRTDYRMLSKSLVRPIARFRAGGKRTPGGHAVATAAAAGAGNLNPNFVRAFFDVVASKRRILLVFSSADRLYWEWEEKFIGAYPRTLDDCADVLEVHVTPHANHIFSLRESQEEMLGVSCGWLQRHF